MPSPKRPPKDDKAREKAIACIKKGKYRYTGHGKDRTLERPVTELDAIHVINNGCRVQQRDDYDEIKKGWSYAFEGYTLQEDWARVIVAFAEDILVIVTVMTVKKS